MLRRWPAAPANLIRAFCPTPIVIVSGTPPIVMLPVRSTGTLISCTVALPVAAPCGSTRIVYVPVAGSVIGSMNPPEP